MQKPEISLKNKYFDSEFYETVKDILNDPEVLKMKNYNQHSSTDCYMHCLLCLKQCQKRICSFRQGRGYHIEAYVAGDLLCAETHGIVGYYADG